MNTRTRRGLTLLWTALFLCSLALQCVQLAAPTAALAVHDEGVFELDGNALSSASPGDDWAAVFGNTDAAFASAFETDAVNTGDDMLTGGGSKDIHDIPSWELATGGVQDKNDIAHAFAAAYISGADNDLVVYFGLDRYAQNGAAQVGFWFLRNQISPSGSSLGTSHVVGDVLVQIDFENGGTNPIARVYEWNGSGITLVSTGASCGTAAANDDRCAISNTANSNTAWAFNPKSGANNVYQPGHFVEGGINLSDLRLDDGCFTTFLAETRSSPSEESTLSDIAYGSFPLCVAPDIETQVKNDQGQGDGMVTINSGESVTDTVTVGGSKGDGTGTVDFFVCGPTNSPQACASGGTAIGNDIELEDGKATSDVFTPSAKPSTGQPDYYCFRVAYTPSADSKYTADQHTNNSTECVKVIPADVRVIKTPNEGTANAGESIEFTLQWGNVGEGKATGVVVTDSLPGTPGLNWSIDRFTGTGSTCSIDGAIGSQILTCNVVSINGNTPASADDLDDNTKNSGSVTVTSGTTPASCAVINNTGRITSANDGTHENPGQITVQCPDVSVVKTPNNGQVNASDAASFSMLVSNAGPGAASGLTLTDPLPAGLTWALGTVTGNTDGVTCSVTGSVGSQVLSCSDSNLMAAGQAFTVTVATTTSALQCATYPNIARVDATNESNDPSVTDDNTDPGAITVNCPNVKALKASDKSPVNAGDPIGFTVTIQNTGTGTAYGATGTDTLPAGIAWTIDGAANGWSIVAGVLTFGPADLAAGASAAVHIVGTTDAADCGVVPNTVTVDAQNESNLPAATADNSASAQVTVNCPNVKALKASDKSPVNAGDPIGFTVTIQNTGTGTAYGATGTDTLPAGIAWTIDGAANGWSIVAGVLTFGPADLAAGASAAVHIVGTTDAADCGVVPNTVTVDAQNESNLPAATANNSASAQVTVNCPNVKVVKDALDGGISAGEVGEFAIVITNDGVGTAYDVSLTDTLPSGVAWTLDAVAFNGVAVVDPGVLCSISGSNLSCPDLGDLIPGSRISISISGDTDLDDCGPLVNTVTIDASNESNAPAITADNSDTATIVVDCPLLGIDKDPDHAAPVLIGDPIGFKLTIGNSGAGTAFGVTVSDTLDSAYTWSIETPVGGWSLVGNVLSFSGNLASNTTSTVHVTAPTTVGNASQCGEVPNTAVLDHTSIDPTPASASETVQCPEIEIVKGADDDLVEPNQTVTFLLDVEVVDGPVTDAVVTDDLPIGQTYVAGSGRSKVSPSATFADDEPTVSADGRTLTWNYSILATGNPSVTIMYRVTIDSDATIATQVNQAELCVSELEGCVSDDEGVTPELPAIGIVKTAGDAADGGVLSTQPGPVTYTYDVTNDGPLPLSDVTVTDDAGTPSDSSDDFEADCPKTTLAVGESMTCTFTIEVHVDTVNIAVARAVTAEGNPVEDDDDAEVVVLEFGLIIDKSNDAPLEPLELPDGSIADLPTADEGETVTYTLAYSLLGDPVTNGVITDVLPVGITYVVDSATDDPQFTFGGYDDATRTLTWTADDVSEDGSVTYQATVDDGAAGLVQPLLNLATIDSDETLPDDGDSQIFVPTIPAAATGTPRPTPRITLPPTDTLDSDTPAPSNPGHAMMLILLALSTVAFVVTLVTPVPASVRERSRR